MEILLAMPFVQNISAICSFYIAQQQSSLLAVPIYLNFTLSIHAIIIYFLCDQ